MKVEIRFKHILCDRTIPPVTEDPLTGISGDDIKKAIATLQLKAHGSHYGTCPNSPDGASKYQDLKISELKIDGVEQRVSEEGYLD